MKKNRQYQKPVIMKEVEGPKPTVIVNPEPIGAVIVLNEDDMPTFVPVCLRCKGDGRWHSTKTGVRALTSSEPLIDETKPCPDCNGTGKK